MTPSRSTWWRAPTSRSNAAPILETKFTYEGEVPIDSGVVQLFRDDAFVGMGELPMVLPGADVRIPFGQDQRIRIVVHDEREESGNVGMVIRDQVNQRRRRFEITSFHSVAMPIEIIDRVPVARDNDIRIDVLKGATPPTTVGPQWPCGCLSLATRGRTAQDGNHPPLLLGQVSAKQGFGAERRRLNRNARGGAGFPGMRVGFLRRAPGKHRRGICSKKEPVGGGMELTLQEPARRTGWYVPAQTRSERTQHAFHPGLPFVFPAFRQKQQERAKPYPPLATLQVASAAQGRARGVAVRRHAGGGFRALRAPARRAQAAARAASTRTTTTS